MHFIHLLKIYLKKTPRAAKLFFYTHVLGGEVNFCLSRLSFWLPHYESQSTTRTRKITRSQKILEDTYHLQI
jgi:hypothetical protein